MSDTRCARCGRCLRSEESDIARLPVDPGAAAIDAIFEGRGPWAELGGVPICPGCQSTTERREIAERIVASIEADVERARVADVEPSLPEPALIAYAMQLRER